MIPLAISTPLLALTILLTALLIDFIIGEPPEKLHPTVWVGKLVESLGPKLKSSDQKSNKIRGTVLVLLSIGFFVIPVYLLATAAMAVHWLVYLITMSFLLKSTFAIRSMEEHVSPIINSLNRGDFDDVRKRTSLIVSRDTSKLNREGIISATVESTSEGIVDGVISPIFFFCLFGITGAVAFRVVNTLDSMIGYRSPELKSFGWFSANLDTIFNYIPARVAAFLIVLSAWIWRENWRGAASCVIKDSNKTRSKNAGWPMAAMAGALGVRLEKPGAYVLGDGNADPTTDHAQRALRLMKTASILFFVIMGALIGLLALFV